MVQGLPKDMNQATGPVYLRPAVITFSQWLVNAKSYQERMRTSAPLATNKLLALERARSLDATGLSEKDTDCEENLMRPEDKEMEETEEAGGQIMELPMFQIGDGEQVCVCSHLSLCHTSHPSHSY